MVENRPMLDSCDTPLLFLVSWLLFKKLFLVETRSTLCKLWRTAVYRLSFRSTTIGSNVLHDFRHLSLASPRSFSSISALFLVDFCSHDIRVYVFRYGFRWRWRIGGMIYVYRLMHCHVHESSARRSLAIDRSVVLRLAFVHRTLLLIGVDGRSWIVIGRFGDNWLVLLLVVHLFVIELYICFYFISWLFVVSTLLKIDDTIFCKESGRGGGRGELFLKCL